MEITEYDVALCSGSFFGVYMVSDKLLSLALSFFREALSFGSSSFRVAAWGYSPHSRLSGFNSPPHLDMRELDSFCV